MKIMQIGTFGSAIRPDMTYGGIQRIISYLDREYTSAGHESYVVSPRGSVVKGKLLTTLEKPLTEKMDEDPRFSSVYELVNANIFHFARTLEHIEEIKPDIVHDHVGRLFPYANGRNFQLLTTLHGPRDLFWEPAFYKEPLSRSKFCAVSRFQQKAYEPIKVDYVVHNGIPTKEFPFSDKKEDYMFMLSLMWEEKGIHHAIDLSKKSGIPLILAGKIRNDPTKMGGKDYFDSRIKPHIDGKQIRFIGELNDEEKKDMYKGAKIYLHPCSVEESFGMVLVEAMACGTPVIAFDRGAVSEVVEHGKTGFVVNSLEQALDHIPRIDSINPRDCRRRVEDLFDSQTMASRYLEVYREIIQTPNSA